MKILKKAEAAIAKWPKAAQVGMAAVLAVALLAMAAYLWVLWTYRGMYDDSVDIVDKPSESLAPVETVPPDLVETPSGPVEQTDIYREEQQRDDVYNILLVGMDARPGETYSRSDTIVLASYNATDHDVSLTSFMRDSWVELPGKGWQRINAATAYGGIGMLVNTVNHNFDLDVQNYIIVRFDGFEDVIDVLGGVDVELTRQEISYINKKLHEEDHDYKHDVKAGPGLVRLTGAQALWHCRNRTIGDGDFSRTDRQRQVLSQIIRQGLETDVTALPGLVQELSRHVSTNLELDLITKLAADALMNKADMRIDTYNIPYEGMWSYANKNGASVIEIDIPGTRDRLHEVLGDEPAQAETETADQVG